MCMHCKCIAIEKQCGIINKKYICGGVIMAEFCLECLNRINETKEPAIKYIMSEELNLCEGCGQWKRTVSMYRLSYWLWKLRFII